MAERRNRGIFDLVAAATAIVTGGLSLILVGVTIAGL
jgi:hypothetical protein